MSNEVKLEDAKPGMWAEFDLTSALGDFFRMGHYVLQLERDTDSEAATVAIALGIEPPLSVTIRRKRIPVLFGSLHDGFKKMSDIENLRIYAEKPEPAATNTLKETPDYPHDLSGIPTEPGLYRAATGSVWYYDGKSWTPITDHKGKYTYADKQSYKQFIETSVKSHRIPFTSIRLPETDGDDTERVMPTEPGWYVDCEGDTYWFDGESYRSLLIEQGGVYTAYEAADYAPYKPIADIEAWVKPWGKN